MSTSATDAVPTYVRRPYRYLTIPGGRSGTGRDDVGAEQGRLLHRTGVPLEAVEVVVRSRIFLVDFVHDAAASVLRRVRRRQILIQTVVRGHVVVGDLVARGLLIRARRHEGRAGERVQRGLVDEHESERSVVVHVAVVDVA